MLLEPPLILIYGQSTHQASRGVHFNLAPRLPAAKLPFDASRMLILTVYEDSTSGFLSWM